MLEQGSGKKIRDQIDFIGSLIKTTPIDAAYNGQSKTSIQVCYHSSPSKKCPELQTQETADDYFYQF